MIVKLTSLYYYHNNNNRVMSTNKETRNLEDINVLSPHHGNANAKIDASHLPSYTTYLISLSV